MSSVKQKKQNKNRTKGREATMLYTHLVKNGIRVPFGTRLQMALISTLQIALASLYLLKIEKNSYRERTGRFSWQRELWDGAYFREGDMRSKIRRQCKMSSSKNIRPVKGLCGNCLSVWGPEPHTPPLHTVYVYTLYLFTLGRAGCISSQ